MLMRCLFYLPADTEYRFLCTMETEEVIDLTDDAPPPPRGVEPPTSAVDLSSSNREADRDRERDKDRDEDRDERRKRSRSREKER